MNLLKAVPRSRLRSWNLLDDFDTEISRFFGTEPFKGTFSPAVDLHETEEAYIVEADMPGLSKDDIEIEIAENVITVKGERKDESDKEEKNYHRLERSYGGFKRSFLIPGGFEHDAVDADFKDGVLHVTLPKPKENQPKRIQVK